MKIIHIHSYINFIDFSTNDFLNKNFDNIIILLGNNNDYKGLYKDNILFFNPSIKNLKKIIGLCKEVDLVIMYNLDGYKSYIINRLPNTVKIIWRFFGMELYGKMPEYVYSETTTKYLKNHHHSSNIINKILNYLKQQIKWGTNFNKEFDKAIVKIDFFLGLSDIEYAFLKENWPALPAFLQYPLSSFKIKENNNRSISNNVLIGNNRSAYNNHIDVLKLIESNPKRDNYLFSLIFNYGQNNEYSDKVREQALKIENVKVIEDFMSLNEYQNFFLSQDAFVLNGYRQMAMGAVFESLISSVKVYLNKKNVMLKWLKEEGFLVFNMEDFSNDMIINNVALSKEQAEFNIKQFEKFRLKYNVEDFQKKIMKLGS